MTVSDIIKTYRHICQQLEQKHLVQVFNALTILLKEYQEWWAIIKKEELEDIYKRFLSYQFGTVQVPDQQNVYNRLIADTYILTEQVTEQLLSRNSTQYEYLQKRFKQVVLFDMQQVMIDLEFHYANMSLDRLLADQQLQSEETISPQNTFEQNLIKLFSYFWLTDKFSDDLQNDLKQLFSHPTIGNTPKCVVISAIMLNSLRSFDVDKILWLMNHTKYPNVEVRQRILVALLLVLARYGKRLESFEVLHARLKLLTDDITILDELESVFLQLVRTSETEAITNHIRTEILPEMIRISPIIKNKMDQMNKQSEEQDEKNPEWQEFFEQNDLSDKIQEFGELQMVGADVYVSTFAALKDFPFFNDIVNWFMPFETDHSHIASLFKGGKAKMLELIMKSPMLCNSDKYSFCLSLRQMPEMQRDMMLQSMHEESDQMQQLMEEQRGLTANASSKSVANQYIQDLYRFYTLFPKHADFQNPLEEVLAIYQTPVFDLLFGGLEERKRIADFYFSKNRYQEASDIYLSIVNQLEDPSKVFEKLGYCFQKLANYASAIHYYLLADSLHSNHIWTLNRLAYCYKHFGKHDEALACYQRLSDLQPENIKILQQIGTCYIEKGAYEEALAIFYKIDYLAPNTPKVGRMLAWSAFVAGKLEQSNQLYDKLIKSTPIEAIDYLNAGHAAWAANNLQCAINYYKSALATSSTEQFIKSFNDDAIYLAKYHITKEQMALLLDVVLLDIKIAL